MDIPFAAYGAIIAVEATTAAVTTDAIWLGQNAGTLSIVANQLSGSETIMLEVFDVALNDWFPFQNNGSSLSLSTETNIINLYHTMAIYRLVKPVTANQVAITLHLQA